MPVNRPPAANGRPPRASYRVRMFRDGFMYAGSSIDVANLRNSATVYFAASPADVELEVDGKASRVGVAVVPPRTAKRLTANGEPFVCIDVSPTHALYRHFMQASNKGLYVLPREHCAELAPLLRDFHSGALSAVDSGHLRRHAIDLTARLLPQPKPLDSRVLDVMQRLRENCFQSVETLAPLVAMSKDWLSHLFQRELGLSLRQYVQTLKINAASGFIGSSENITQIAMAAGFADSAHFCKVWKSHFGVSPNQLFSNQGLDLHVMPRQAG